MGALAIVAWSLSLSSFLIPIMHLRAFYVAYDSSLTARHIFKVPIRIYDDIVSGMVAASSIMSYRSVKVLPIGKYWHMPTAPSSNISRICLFCVAQHWFCFLLHKSLFTYLLRCTTSPLRLAKYFNFKANPMISGELCGELPGESPTYSSKNRMFSPIIRSSAIWSKPSRV